MKLKFIILSITFLFSAVTLSAAEREAALKRDFGTLYGTLNTPEGGSDTAVLMIAGSGPTDRSCNSPQSGLYTDSFVYLAQALEEQGIASLRYDKRGIGASAYNDPQKLLEVTFDDYISDAQAWVAWMHEQGFKKVVFAGHSEGSLIALCAASDGNKADSIKIAGIVSLAGAGFPIDEVVLAQLSAQLASVNPGLLIRATSVFSSLRQGKTVDNYPQELSMLFLPYLQHYWISQMKYKPQEVIAKVGVPILIINGDNDLQISVANAEALKKAKPEAELLILPGMTHTLKQSAGHDIQGQMAAYMNASQPLDTAVPEAIVRFVRTL